MLSECLVLCIVDSNQDAVHVRRTYPTSEKHGRASTNDCIYPGKPFPLQTRYRLGDMVCFISFDTRVFFTFFFSNCAPWVQNPMLALLGGICVSPPVPRPLLYSSIMSIYEYLPLLVMRLTRHFK
jgi:hypothetical protein